MIQRVMPDLMGLKNVVVINDEAHHCYREKPSGAEEKDSRATSEGSREEQRSRAHLDVRPRSGESQARGLKVVDLSATPFFLSGSGWPKARCFLGQ